MIGRIKRIIKDYSWRLYVWSMPSKEEYFYKEALTRFETKYIDSSFPYQKYEKDINPYFLKYGFKFSRLDCEYYAQCTGVKSDLYIPVTLWYRCIEPFLNKEKWRIGYCDKNLFYRFVNLKEAQKHVDILLPERVICCDNGRFFRGDVMDPITKQEAIDVLISYGEDLIIKPTINTRNGRGVSKIHVSALRREDISSLFEKYGDNFIVQKVVIQHPDLAAFNPSSVNTIRITTYQDFAGNVKVLYASQRFGSPGRVFDNADDPTGDGGFCAINSDGTVKREVHHFRKLRTEKLKDDIKGVIPSYEKVIEAVKYLHTLFPQFAIIGWDMTVTPEGHPLMIEYNFAPGLGTCQFVHGPLFSKEDLDEIMDRMSKNTFNYVVQKRLCFNEKPENNITFTK